MNQTSLTSRTLRIGISVLLVVACLRAQRARTPPVIAPDTSKDEPVELSPFEVRASTDVGYQATETLAGTRMASSLKDVATQVNVMTPEFLQDLAITDLESAVRYSLNGEDYSQTFPVETPNNAALRDTISYGANTTRTRNLGNANITHDFFDTNVRVDSYNTERFTFASGPNSILFGNSSPGGTVDTTLKRASLNRRQYSVQLRVDDLGGYRTVADIDQPIVREMLGFRLIQLTDRTKDWREPAFNNQDRYFGALTFRPFKKLTVRGYYERVFNHLQTATNTLMQDHVTLWRKYGSPTFNNRAPYVAPAAVPAGRNPLDPALLPASLFTQERAAGETRNYVFFSDRGIVAPVSTMLRSVTVRGYDGMLLPPDNWEHSVTDPSLYPFDVSVAGNGNQSKVSAWIRGVTLEFNPIKNLYFEAGVNQEQLHQRGANLYRGTDMDLRYDPNLYLDDGVTPNPNLNKLYINSNLDVNVNGRQTFTSREQKRLSAAYDFDLTRRENWTRWLGRHRVAAMYEDYESVSGSQSMSFRIISDNTFITGAALANPNNEQRKPIFRYYFEPGQRPYAQFPIDPLGSGGQTWPGLQDSAGHPVVIAGLDNPYGSQEAATFSRKRLLSDTFATQSTFLDGRVVVTYGRRRDRTKLYQNDRSGAGVTSERVQFRPDTPANQNNFVNMNQVLNSDTGIDWRRVNYASPVATLKGAVVHPLRWLSLTYSKSDSTIVGTSLPTKLDGALASYNTGKSKDYGIALRFLDDRVSIRWVRYETFSANSGSSLGLNSPSGTARGLNSLGNNIRPNTSAIDRTIQLADGATGTSERYQWYLNALTRIAPGGASTLPFGTGHNDLAFQSDRRSKGDEVTLTGKPIRNWQVSLSASKSLSAETNVAPEWDELLKERIPIWMEKGNPVAGSIAPTTAFPYFPGYKYLNLPLAINSGGGVTIGEMLFPYYVRTLNWIKYSAGKPQARERMYRVTFTNRYDFRSGRLKGLNVGAVYVWRSTAATGYPVVRKPNAYPALADPRSSSSTVDLDLDDVDNPWRSGALVTFDGFATYERKLFRDKVRWKLQLNIRNLLDNTDFMAQRTMTNGVDAVFTIPEGRRFILTSTFMF